MKCCTKCKEIKELGFFFKHKNNKDGLSIYCKLCDMERNNTRKKELREKGDKPIKGRPKIHQTPELQRKAQLDSKKKYHKNKILDPKYRIIINTRNRIGQILKDNNLLKTEKTIKYLGCSKTELSQHLESLFTSEMNWDNYGKDRYWEVDHIIPCNNFTGTEWEIFHYTNLRPMIIEDNRRKWSHFPK